MAKKSESLVQTPGNLVAKLGEVIEQLARITPGGKEHAHRLVGMARFAVMKQPKLEMCTIRSVYLSIAQAARLSLDCGNPRGQAYLVPFGNQATLIIGYKGMIDLAYDSGVALIEARCVYEGDEFEYHYGLIPKLEHIPCGEDNKQKIVAAYAIARLENGQNIFRVLTRNQVDEAKRRSKTVSGGAWVTDYDAMAMKTAVRRLEPFLPQNPKLEAAFELDRRVDKDIGKTGYSDILDGVKTPFDEEKIIEGEVEVKEPAPVEPRPNKQTGPAVVKLPLTESSRKLGIFGERIRKLKNQHEQKNWVKKHEAEFGGLQEHDRKVLSKMLTDKSQSWSQMKMGE